MKSFLVLNVGLFFLGYSSIGILQGEENIPTGVMTSQQDDYLLPWVPTLSHAKAKTTIKSKNHPSRVEEIIQEAFTAIYDGRYELAVKKCEDALRIDSMNATAIGRMGSAFYLDGEQEKAITLWKRALEMEPNNQTAIRYLGKLTEK
ncbi:MAG: hypothetical protein KCHDKBKB_02429 [Elusimicrobia bacterium]|nr:hypothetical protein [Elusimicrobiota bacterium]